MFTIKDSGWSYINELYLNGAEPAYIASALNLAILSMLESQIRRDTWVMPRTTGTMVTPNADFTGTDSVVGSLTLSNANELVEVLNSMIEIKDEAWNYIDTIYFSGSSPTYTVSQLNLAILSMLESQIRRDRWVMPRTTGMMWNVYLQENVEFDLKITNVSELTEILQKEASLIEKLEADQDLLNDFESIFLNEGYTRRDFVATIAQVVCPKDGNYSESDFLNTLPWAAELFTKWHNVFTEVKQAIEAVYHKGENILLPERLLAGNVDYEPTGKILFSIAITLFEQYKIKNPEKTPTVNEMGTLIENFFENVTEVEAMLNNPNFCALFKINNADVFNVDYRDTKQKQDKKGFILSFVFGIANDWIGESRLNKDVGFNSVKEYIEFMKDAAMLLSDPHFKRVFDWPDLDTSLRVGNSDNLNNVLKIAYYFCENIGEGSGENWRSVDELLEYFKIAARIKPYVEKYARENSVVSGKYRFFSKFESNPAMKMRIGDLGLLFRNAEVIYRLGQGDYVLNTGVVYDKEKGQITISSYSGAITYTKAGEAGEDYAATDKITFDVATGNVVSTTKVVIVNGSIVEEVTFYEDGARAVFTEDIEGITKKGNEVIFSNNLLKNTYVSPIWLETKGIKKRTEERKLDEYGRPVEVKAGDYIAVYTYSSVDSMVPSGSQTYYKSVNEYSRVQTDRRDIVYPVLGVESLTDEAKEDARTLNYMILQDSVLRDAFTRAGYDTQEKIEELSPEIIISVIGEYVLQDTLLFAAYRNAGKFPDEEVFPKDMQKTRIELLDISGREYKTLTVDEQKKLILFNAGVLNLVHVGLLDIKVIRDHLEKQEETVETRLTGGMETDVSVVRDQMNMDRIIETGWKERNETVVNKEVKADKEDIAIGNTGLKFVKSEFSDTWEVTNRDGVPVVTVMPRNGKLSWSVYQNGERELVLMIPTGEVDFEGNSEVAVLNPNTGELQKYEYYLKDDPMNRKAWEMDTNEEWKGVYTYVEGTAIIETSELLHYENGSWVSVHKSIGQDFLPAHKVLTDEILEELSGLNINRNTILQKYEIRPQDGDPYIAYQIAGDFLGRVVLVLLPGGEKILNTEFGAGESFAKESIMYSKSGVPLYYMKATGREDKKAGLVEVEVRDASREGRFVGYWWYKTDAMSQKMKVVSPDGDWVTEYEYVSPMSQDVKKVVLQYRGNVTMSAEVDYSVGQRPLDEVIAEAGGNADMLREFMRNGYARNTLVMTVHVGTFAMNETGTMESLGTRTEYKLKGDTFGRALLVVLENGQIFTNVSLDESSDRINQTIVYDWNGEALYAKTPTGRELVIDGKSYAEVKVVSKNGSGAFYHAYHEDSPLGREMYQLVLDNTQLIKLEYKEGSEQMTGSKRYAAVENPDGSYSVGELLESTVFVEEMEFDRTGGTVEEFDVFVEHLPSDIDIQYDGKKPVIQKRKIIDHKNRHMRYEYGIKGDVIGRWILREDSIPEMRSGDLAGADFPIDTKTVKLDTDVSAGSRQYNRDGLAIFEYYPLPKEDDTSKVKVILLVTGSEYVMYLDTNWPYRVLREKRGEKNIIYVYKGEYELTPVLVRTEQEGSLPITSTNKSDVNIKDIAPFMAGMDGLDGAHTLRKMEAYNPNTGERIDEYYNSENQKVIEVRHTEEGPVYTLYLDFIPGTQIATKSVTGIEVNGEFFKRGVSSTEIRTDMNIPLIQEVLIPAFGESAEKKVKCTVHNKKDTYFGIRYREYRDSEGNLIMQEKNGQRIYILEHIPNVPDGIMHAIIVSGGGKVIKEIRDGHIDTAPLDSDTRKFVHVTEEDFENGVIIEKYYREGKLMYEKYPDNRVIVYDEFVPGTDFSRHGIILKDGVRVGEINNYIDHDASGNTIIRTVVKEEKNGTKEETVIQHGLSGNKLHEKKNDIIFYIKPAIIDGRQVQGIAVVDLGMTTAELPENIKSHYKGTEPVSVGYYFDSNNELITDLPIQGYYVETNDKIAGFDDCKIVEEVTPEGKFKIARVINSAGKEVASITILPEGAHLVELVGEEKAGDDEVDRGTYYRAEKEDGVYTYTADDWYSKSYYEEEFTIDLSSGSIPDDLGDFWTDISSQIPLNQRDFAGSKIRIGLGKIISTLGISVGDKVTILKVKSVIKDNGIVYTYRVKEDPSARVLVFVATTEEPSVLVNTNWHNEFPIGGYEFNSLGLVYKLHSEVEPVLSGELLEGLDSELVSKLAESGVSIDKDIPLAKVTKSLLPNADESKAIPSLVRYIMRDDPLGRDYVKEENGQIRYLKWNISLPNIPFGRSPGEVVMVKGVGKVRETEFVSNDDSGYSYRVVCELRDGIPYENPSIVIRYDYKTGIVSEHYVNEEWKLYSKDSIPLYLTKVEGAKLNTSWQVEGGEESLQSVFSVKSYDDAENKYLLITENIVGSEGRMGRNARLIRNGELWTIQEGEGAGRIVHTEVFYNPFTEKFYNSFPGRALRWISFITHLQEKGEDKETKLEEAGTQGVPVITTVPSEGVEGTIGEPEDKGKGIIIKVPEMPVYRNWLQAIPAYLVWGVLAGITVLMILSMKAKEKVKTMLTGRKEKRAERTKSEDLKRKAIIFRELVGGIKIPINIEDKNKYLSDYLRNNGFSGDEVKVLLKQNIDWEKNEIDLEAIEEAPRLGDLDTLYPKAVVVKELLEKKLITNDDIDEAVWQAESSDQLAGEAVKWDRIMKILVNKAQNKVLGEIKLGDLSHINDLLPTPEANVLKYIVANNIISNDLIQEIADETDNMMEFVMKLVDEGIIRPVFNDITFETFGDIVKEDVRETIYQTVLGEIFPYIARDPQIISELNTTGDITYLKYPMNHATEPVTLKELIVLKYLQLNQTDSKCGFGQLSLFWPFMMYIVRTIVLRNQNQSSANIQETVMKYLKVASVLMQSEVMCRYKAVTEYRDTGLFEGTRLVDVFSDMDFYDLFIYLHQEGKTLEQVVQDYNTANPGKQIAIDIDTLAINWASKENIFLKVVAAGPWRNNAKDGVITEFAKGVTEHAEQFKKLTLWLAGRHHPEATRADESTRKEEDKWYKFWKGLGIVPFYISRIFAPLFHPIKYWGMTKAEAGIAIITALTGAAVGVYILIGLSSLAGGLTVIAGSLLLTPILFGKATSVKEKGFWVAIVGTTIVYIFGVMIDALFWKAELIQWMTPGFYATVGLWLLMIIPTLISVYHFTVSIRSLYELRSNMWSEEAKKLVGLSSLLTFKLDWEGKFGDWYAEIREAENRMPILPNGESAHEYFTRLINWMYRRYLLSETEKNLWLNALDGKANRRFVRPKSRKAFEILYNAFFTISQKKPMTDNFAMLQPTTTHVMGSGELITHTVWNSFRKGTFDNHPDDPDKKASLLGYMARTYNEEWNNVIDSLELVIAPDLADKLRAVNEWTDILDLLKDLDNDTFNMVSQAFINFLNELRPSNASVIDSMGTDWIEYHLYLSSSLGDYEYYRRVEELAGQYTSLSDAYEYLRFDIAVNAPGMPGDNPPAVPARGSMPRAGVEPLARTLTSDVFVRNYQRYQSMLELKLRHVYRDVMFGQKLGNYDAVRTAVTGKGLSELPNVGGVVQRADALADWSGGNEKQFIYEVLIDPANSGLAGQYEELRQAMGLVYGTAHNNARFGFHGPKDSLFPIKNPAIANHFWLFYNRSVNYDSLVRAYPGQNTWRMSYATIVGRNPHIANINPIMKVWGTTSKAFPVTNLYGIAQEVFTGEVQRARRGMLTFYGKGLPRAQTSCAIITPPGEDSASFLVEQREQPLHESTQIDYFMFEWGRPSLLAESIGSTELRYAYNVTRFMMDRGQFALFFNKDLGYDKKLSHLFLFFHYFVSPFAILLLILLPYLAPFSAFAFLKPAGYFIGISYLFMEAINTNNFIRHWRQTGAFIPSLLLMTRDILVATPFYVVLIPQFFKGVWNASKELFSFIATVKDTLLSKQSPVERYKQTMFYNNLPLNIILGVLGIMGWLFGFFAMTPIGPSILIFYLLASVSFIAGFSMFDRFVMNTKKGDLLTGMSGGFIALTWLVATIFEGSNLISQYGLMGAAGATIAAAIVAVVYRSIIGRSVFSDLKTLFKAIWDYIHMGFNKEFISILDKEIEGAKKEEEKKTKEEQKAKILRLMLLPPTIFLGFIIGIILSVVVPMPVYILIPIGLVIAFVVMVGIHIKLTLPKKPTPPAQPTTPPSGGAKVMEAGSGILTIKYVLENTDSVFHWFMGLGLGWQVLIVAGVIGGFIGLGVYLWRKNIKTSSLIDKEAEAVQTAIAVVPDKQTEVINLIDSLIANPNLSKADLPNVPMEGEINDEQLRSTLQELKKAVISSPANAGSVLYILGKQSLVDIIRSTGELMPINGGVLKIIDASVLESVDIDSFMRTVNTDNTKPVVVDLTGTHNDIIQIVRGLGIAVVENRELTGNVPEDIAMTNALRQYQGFRVVSREVVTTIENATKWSYAETIRYIVCSKNLTNAALLSLYNALPKDVKEALRRADITAETITRATIQNTGLTTASYILQEYRDRQAVIEVAA
jgi:hypothetical protein